MPRALETVLLRCLEKRPDQRFASARALAEDLRRVAGGQSVRARPISFFRRGARQLGRKPLVAASVVALVGIAMVLLALTLMRSPSSWAEDVSPSWIQLRQDAWIQLFASNDAPVLVELDRKMQAFQPTTPDEADEARILRAWIAYKRLDRERALELLEGPAGFRSQRAALYLRAITLRSMWRYDEAQDEVTRAGSLPARTRLDHVLAALYRGTQQAKRTEARAACERMVEACPDYLPARIVQVELARADQDYEAARQACGTLLLMRPGDPTLLLLRGYVHRKARQWAAAERDFRAALAANPRYEEVRVALYYLLRGLGGARRIEGDRVLALGLEIEPRSRWLLNARGWERYLAGDPAGAAGDFAAALRVDPCLELAQINLGNALLALGKESEALEHWQRVIDDPRQPPANVAGMLHERARCHWRQGQREAAYRDLRAALCICYRPLVQDKLALYLMQEERYGEARVELDQLLERVPANRTARAHRAECRLFTGDLDGARTDILKALSLWGSEAPAWAWLVRAEVAILADDVATADEVFETALKRPKLERQERLGLQIQRAGYELDRTERTAEAGRALEACRELLKPGDPVEDARLVDYLGVRVAGRQEGWKAAVARWDSSGLPSTGSGSGGGRFELLRAWVSLAREPGQKGGEGRVAPGSEPLRELARLRLAGRNPDRAGLERVPAPAPEDGPGAWVLGEAWLALGDASRARPLLKQARRQLDFGLVHLHEAEALARLDRLPEAAAALGQALRKGVPRYRCLCRLTRSGVVWTEEMRAPLLAR